MTVDGKGNATVNAMTILAGPNANAELANSWTRDANNYWNAGKWRYGRCQVNFNLRFTTDVPDPNSNDSGIWWSGLTGQDLAHETGHLLGLGDDDYGLLSVGNHQGHMMSNSVISDVVQHEVDDVLAGRAYGSK